MHTYDAIGRKKMQLEGHSGSVTSVAISSHSKWIVHLLYCNRLGS